MLLSLSFLYTIIYPLNKLTLKVGGFRKIQKRLRVEDFYFFFRQFILSDLMLLFLYCEPYVKRIFNPKKREVVFDVDAHIGTYTLRTAKIVGRRISCKLRTR